MRSPFGKLLGRTWHKSEVYGIAARSYCASPFSDEPWMHSHVELRDADGVIQPGYGWIFPLGDGTVNLGCGALSTDARPAKVNTKKLLALYASQQREAWQLGPEQAVASALLPRLSSTPFSSRLSTDDWPPPQPAATTARTANHFKD